MVFLIHTQTTPKYSNHDMGSRMRKVKAKFKTLWLKHGNVPSRQLSILHTHIPHKYQISIYTLKCSKSSRLYSSQSPWSSFSTKSACQTFSADRSSTSSRHCHHREATSFIYSPRKRKKIHKTSMLQWMHHFKFWLKYARNTFKMGFFLPKSSIPLSFPCFSILQEWILGILAA